jgi:serine/threonine-protein kinase
MDRLRAALADRYRIERELGAGGMATVYLAQDLKHDRNVAIKVLRPELAAVIGAERFLSEIKTTANLQHPHILALHDSGEADSFLFYVMPYVEGESLRDRLSREKQLPINEAVRIATEVAGALDYAHRHGVVHRDIKPENILLHDGRALVADFGIALAASSAGGRMTETGMSLGTPTYMSPEQATAEKEISGRSDVYSLAAVLYEMLTGDPPHVGSSAQQIIMKIIADPVKPVTALRRTVPPHVEAAVAQALEKLPADRFQTAGEFAAALLETSFRPAHRLGFGSGARAGLRQVAVLVGVAAVAVLAGLWVGRSMGGKAEPTAPSIRRWSLTLPAEAPLALTGPGPLGIWQLAVALAPTGDRLAYVSRRGGTTMLAVRPLERDSAVVLPGTEGAYHPFFSPDGRWIAFFAGAELRKVSVEGGTPVTLTTVERPSGAVWHQPDEIILFQQDGFEMRRVSASGGRDSTMLLGSQFGEPDILPGGEWAVGTLGSGQLALLSLKDASLLAITRRGVIPLDSVQLGDLLFGFSPKYVSSGHLVFGSGDGVLMALPFDGTSHLVRGGTVPVVDGVRIEEGYGFAQYAIAQDGTLVFVPGKNQLHGFIASIRPDGRFDTLPLPRAQYTQPRMSPDGTRLAVQVRKAVAGWEIVVMDLTTGVPQRIEVEGNYRAFPGAWTSDGKALMVGLFHPVRNVFLGTKMYTLAERSWGEMMRFNGSYVSIAPGGKEFVYSNFRTGELYIRPLSGDTTSKPIPARGWAASFSPDGRWLAWGGADGGVAVSPLPPTGAIYNVVERGQQPIWSPDGQRLIYRDGRRFYEVPVEVSGGFRAGRPRAVAEGPFIRTFAWNHTMTKAGRLVAMIAIPGDATRELGVITGFAQDLTRRAPPQVRP